MAEKQLLFGDEARMTVLRGGPGTCQGGQGDVGPQRPQRDSPEASGSPMITKDGVTVAKEIVLPNPYENMGAQLVREVASKTSETAGDGTTTATVLAEAIVREGVRHLAAGAPAPELKRGPAIPARSCFSESERSTVRWGSTP